MQQDQDHSSETLRHVLKDIAHVERVLLHHAETSSEACHAVALKQHAQLLITHLQQHAQQSLGALVKARSQSANAHSAKVSTAVSEGALNTSTTALRTVFDSELLSELCAVLHSLYVRQARLDAPPGAPTDAVEGPADHAGDNSMPGPETQLVDSANLAVNGMASASSMHFGQSEEHEHQIVPPRSISPSAGHAKQHADVHQHCNEDSHQTAALRCMGLASCWPHGHVCTIWQMDSCPACNCQAIATIAGAKLYGRSCVMHYMQRQSGEAGTSSCQSSS